MKQRDERMRVIKDTRNFYVHAYGTIDLPSVWTTLVEDIPALQSACADLLENHRSASTSE